MISDPRTTPDSRLGRCVFAISVALLGHYLAFFMQMRPALYVGAGPKRCAGAKNEHGEHQKDDGVNIEHVLCEL